jgi:hypothetical protein
LERVEFVNHGARISVIFGGQHDAIVASVSEEDDDADHQGGGEVPAVGECEGLRH